MHTHENLLFKGLCLFFVARCSTNALDNLNYDLQKELLRQPSPQTLQPSSSSFGLSELEEKRQDTEEHSKDFIFDQPLSPHGPPSFLKPSNEEEKQKRKQKHVSTSTTTGEHSSRGPPPSLTMERKRAEEHNFCASSTSSQPSSLHRPPSPPSIELFEERLRNLKKASSSDETQPREVLLAPYRTLHRRELSKDIAGDSSEGSASAESPRSQSKTTSLENLPEESLTEEETKSLVKQEKYCISTDSEEKAERLLLYDRPGTANTWLYFRRFIASDPLCSTNPNVTFVAINPVEISSHKFFQSKSINIPVEDGSIGLRRVQFQYYAPSVNKDPVWKRFLECGCTISDPTKNVSDICVEGKIVNFSRGVGGDKSFFLYRFNSSTGFYNVIAHICF